jgi:hypothetical protein
MGFQGTDGFCVYDAAGSLAFRVDKLLPAPEALRRGVAAHGRPRRAASGPPPSGV